MNANPSALTQILVHLDATSHSSQRLAAARALAGEHGAAVTALYAVTPAMLALPFAADGGAVATTILQDMDDERRANVRAAFDNMMKTEGPGVSWAEATGFPVEGSFARQALYADLMVLGQREGSDPGSAGVPPDFVQSVLADSGKPALVLPHDGKLGAIGKTVTIAWKPTRETARAVAAALPLLRRASRVHIQSWGELDDEVAGHRLTLDSYLRQRGIEAIWHREGGPEPESLGELLLSRCCDLEADLLVMGCYGHSRAREWVMGGTTRTVLRSMTLPVLMSH